MLTLDAVRTAVLSDQPWHRLDALVRAEQAAGRKVKDIFDALHGMSSAIDAMPGLSEDGSDAFGDTLDKLTGYCRADQCYQDPPNTTLPTELEIIQLPRWVRVAYAARCARRVLPLIPPGTLTTDDLQSLSANIAAGELTAARSQNVEFDSLQKLKNTAAWIQVYAAKVPAESVGRDDAAYTVAQCATFAVTAASPWFDITPYIRRDFDHLASLAEWQQWDDDTPVPPEVFGPLWPEGPPKGWPPVTDVPQRAELVVEAFARDRATEQMIEDDLVHLFNALNRYHIARSGARLTLDQFRSLLPAHVPVEV